MDTIARFCDLHLGKGVVYAKDTPNFIANRIGIFSALNIMRLMQEMDLSIEEVDALTGTAAGWPKTATFRLADLVGLDVFGHVVRNTLTNIQDERSDLKLPDFFKQPCSSANGSATKRSRASIARRRKTARTRSWRSTGRPWSTARRSGPSSLRSKWQRASTTCRSVCARCWRRQRTKSSAFLWSALSDLWTYAANRIGEISDSVVEIDRAMKLGFNWEMGPFELWDAAGVAKTVKRMQVDGKPVSANVEKLLASGNEHWYTDDLKAASGRAYFDLNSGHYTSEKVPAGVWSVTVAKKSGLVVKKNPGASLSRHW